MAFDSLVRNGIALAKSLTSSLQMNVQHFPWTGQTDRMKPTYGDPITYPALVEYKSELIRIATGEEKQAKTKVTFLAPITVNGADDRQEPVDPRDKIVLPDGRTGPILEIKGLGDPVTGYPYMFEVTLGDSQ
jgi:hypothetical protein